MHPNLVNSDDIGMLKTGCGNCLRPKPLDEFGTGTRPYWRQHFEGHQPVQAPLSRLVNNPHPAFANPLQNLVIAERGAFGRPVWPANSFDLFRRFDLLNTSARLQSHRG